MTGQISAALPLSKFVGGDARVAPRGPFGLWSMIDQIRYGGLPEPASWALMLIGFATIGSALRGLIMANRRLAKLQPGSNEDTDTDTD